MEMWAGFECTLNRVGDRYQDQLLPQERDKRTACLRALPRLGVKAFRYRVAWEDVATPWEWIEEDITFLTDHDIKPIIGLLHHGSGPKETSLIAHDFAKSQNLMRLRPLSVSRDYWRCRSRLP